MKVEELLKKFEQNKSENSCNGAEKTFTDAEQAEKVFKVLKEKLYDIRNWNDYSALSSYALFNEDGTPHDSSKLSVGIFNRISLTASGKYDWVKVIHITDTADELVITVKPCYDPTAKEVDKSVISHFFTDESANNFCVLKKGTTVKIYVIGTDEKRNTSETSGAAQTIRNVAVNIGTSLGVQSAEWNKFCRHFLESTAEEVTGKSAE